MGVVEFRLLGSVEMLVNGCCVWIGPPKRRAVLAALLVDAGTPVPAEVLIDRVWGDSPPTAARSTLYGNITRIRHALTAATVAGGQPPGPIRRSGGYLLDVCSEAVDLHRFRRLVRLSRESRSAPETLARLLRDVLGLWRGTPLTGVTGAWADRVRTALERQRVDAVVRWAELESHLGRAEAVIDDLADAVAGDPLAEPLIAALMRALVLTGREAEALRCYADARERLRAELGAEPGPELRGLHQAMLRGECYPALAPTRYAPAPPPVPRQLPPDVSTFTGRPDEVAALDRLLAGSGSQAPAGMLVAISGTAGVGKTALAVHWAHRVADRFPDGQLYVDLRGYDPDQPVRADHALVAFLHALGLDEAAIPADTAERAALYRTLVADRRLLVILDNAADVDQVRDLLPGGPSCFALVTSRDSLPALVARHGAHRLELDLLTAEDAVTLLGTLVGARVHEDPPAAAALAEKCAMLPLALRIIAEYLIADATATLATVIGELADQGRRRDLLAAGGAMRTAVSTVFSWSYDRLEPAAARAFRLLGQHPGVDIDHYAAAHLLDVDLATSERLLAVLTQAHLVHTTGPGRFGMHDLLRAYAADLATCPDAGPAAENDADGRAVNRLLTHYERTAARATAMLFPHDKPHGYAPAHSGAPAGGPTPQFADPDAARAWLHAELPNLITTGEYAAVRHLRFAVHIAILLTRHLDATGQWWDALSLYAPALATSRHLADRAATAATPHQATLAGWRLGHCRHALGDF